MEKRQPPQPPREKPRGYMGPPRTTTVEAATKVLQDGMRSFMRKLADELERRAADGDFSRYTGTAAISQIAQELRDTEAWTREILK